MGDSVIQGRPFPQSGKEQSEPRWATGATFPREPYRPLGVVAAWLVGLLAAGGILDILDIGLSAIGLLMLGRVASSPQEVAAGSYAVLETVEMVFGGLATLVYLATGVVFLVWFRRAYRNVLAFDSAATMRYAPGWAVGAWFVPFLNLVRPKRIMDDVWRASDPAPHVRTANWADAEPAKLTMVWWLAWLLSLWSNNATFRVSWRADTVTDYVQSYRLALLTAALDCVVAVLAILVVYKVSNRMRRRAMELAREGQLPAVFRHPAHA